jgi:uncharacterized protein YeaC (DUF1315 family)
MAEKITLILTPEEYRRLDRLLEDAVYPEGTEGLPRSPEDKALLLRISSQAQRP